jgi:hypothetical protein
MKSVNTRSETCIENFVYYSVYINGEQVKILKQTIFVFYCNVIFNRGDEKKTLKLPNQDSGHTGQYSHRVPTD